MQVKICGIRSEEEARQLATMPIDFFGLIFAKSKRQLTLSKAKKIATIFLQEGKKLVALVTLEEADLIEEILTTIDFAVIQLHDDFTLDFCQQLSKRHSHLQIWRAFAIKDFLPPAIYTFLDAGITPVLDSKGELKGGTGKTFDWQLLQSLPKKSFVLAGGLSLENAKAAQKLSPLCLDFNSKLETNNAKDPAKVAQLINMLEG